MYFRRLNFKIPNCLRIPRKTNYSVGELSLDLINKTFNEFVDQANELNRHVTKHGFEDVKQINLFKRYKEFYWKFTLFVQTIHRICFEYNGNISAFFKFAKNKRIKRRWFFSFKKKICKIISFKTNNFKQFFYKSRKPKRIKLVYPHHVRKMICLVWIFYLKPSQLAFINFTNLWLKLCNKEMLAKLWDFSKLSATTLRKILNEDERTKQLTKLTLVKDHPFRNKPKPFGHLQLDFKVFGRNQTGAGKYVYCLDCVCTQTRINFSKIVDPANSTNLMITLEEGRLFYESLSIKLALIRTDNAMFFKRNNFVVSDMFNDWCNQHHIHHQFIPLGEPEADGCVERYHRDMDDILVLKLVKLCGVKCISECVRKFSHWATFERYVHFNNWKIYQLKTIYETYWCNWIS